MGIEEKERKKEGEGNGEKIGRWSAGVENECFVMEVKVMNDGVKGAVLGQVCGNGNVHRLLGLPDVSGLGELGHGHWKGSLCSDQMY